MWWIYVICLSIACVTAAYVFQFLANKIFEFESRFVFQSRVWQFVAVYTDQTQATNGKLQYINKV